MVSKITASKAINMFKIATGYWISRLSRNPVVFGYPASVSIEPTTSCNLRCPECPSGLRSFTRPTGMLDPKFFESVIDQIHSHIFYLVFYFQGEPYLNPRFLEMVNYAASRKIYTATSTNGHYLDNEVAKKTVESGLDRLIISIDGTTQEIYEQYRIGGNLSKVIEGAKNVLRWRKELGSRTPQVIFQFLVVKPNQHQIKDAEQLALNTGVDKIVFKTAQVYDYENGNALIPTIEKYSRYKKNDSGKFEIRNKLLNHCWRLWNSAVITWDGKLLPCCFDKDAHYAMGKLETESFNSIWKSKGYMKFRRSVLHSRKETDICTNCTEGTTVFS